MLTVDVDKSLEFATDLLEDLGIPVIDEDGNYRGIDVIIIDLACAWSKVDDESKINIFIAILKYFPAYINKTGKEIGSTFRSVLEKLR